MTDNRGRDRALWHYKAANRASLLLEPRVQNLAPTLSCLKGNDSGRRMSQIFAQISGSITRAQFGSVLSRFSNGYHCVFRFASSTDSHSSATREGPKKSVQAH